MRFVKGKTKVLHLPKTASTTFTAGDLVIFSSGYVATATTQSTKHIGIILESVASTDTDYASATKVAVQVPTDKYCEIEADVTGTLTTTSLGTAYDLSDASTVNQGGTTYGVMTCVGYISATKGRFICNSLLDVYDSGT